MSGLEIEPIPQESEVFVGRNVEIQVLYDKFESDEPGKPNPRRLIEFYGTPGIGKSALLQHVYEAPREGAVTALVDLAEVQTVDQLVLKLALQLGIEQGEGENTKTLVAKVKAKAETAKLILLFDNSDQFEIVHEESGNPGGYIPLEDDVVLPLLKSENVVLGFAGPRWLRWTRFNTRRQVETHELDVLNKDDHVELVSALGVGKELSSELWSYTYGHPLFTKVIINALVQDNGVLPEQLDSEFLANNQTLIQRVVRQTIEDTYLSRFDNLSLESGDLVREYGGAYDLKKLFEMAMILRKFEVTPLKRIATRFDPNGDYDQRPGGYYLDAIKDMQVTELVCWSSERGGYCDSLPAMRMVMNKNLQMREPERYKFLHQAAAEQYNDWIVRYPVHADSYTRERIWHLAHTEQQEGSIVQDFSTCWDGLLVNDSVAWDLPDMIDGLTKITEDEELKVEFPILHVRICEVIKKLQGGNLEV